jgi:excisionase family DNA binding protein
MSQLKPLLLRIDETAALLGVRRTKVYQLIRAGILPTVRWTGDLRVPRVPLGSLVADGMKPAKESEPRHRLGTNGAARFFSGLSDEELRELERAAAPSTTPRPPMPMPNLHRTAEGYLKAIQYQAWRRLRRNGRSSVESVSRRGGSTVHQSPGRPRWTMTKIIDES